MRGPVRPVVGIVAATSLPYVAASALVGLVLTALLAGLLPTRVASAGGLAMSVTPSTDLVDGQSVHVAVSGLPPDVGFSSLWQCPAGSADTSTCIFVAGMGSPSSGGEAAADVGVLGVIKPFGGPDVDCRTGAGCEFRLEAFGPTGPITTVVPLGFDPAGALRPPAAASAAPSSGLDLADAVTVSGSNFDWWRQDVSVAQCRSDAIEEFGCWISGIPALLDAAGSFATDYRVGTLVWIGDFPSSPTPDPPTLDTFDCRAVAGSCSLVVRSGSSDPILLPLTFRADAAEGTPPDITPPIFPPIPEPPPPGSGEGQFPLDPAGRRYLDLVFDGIEVIENVVYWPDAPPLPEAAPEVQREDLLADIYLPEGDTLDQRPVVIAFEAGPLSWVLQDYVRRGYVVVVPEVRGRPSTPGLEALLQTRQGLHDGAGAVRWLRANAEKYGLHPEAYAATGYSGAGVLSMALAWGQKNSPEVTEIDLWGLLTIPLPGSIPWGDWHAEQPAGIAAAFPTAAWYPRELIDAGEPPMLMFNGTGDPTYAFESVEQICPAARDVGVTCTLRTFDTGHDLSAFNPEMSEESAAFLYENMLQPLGVLDSQTDPAPTTTTTTAAPATPVSAAPQFTG